ncbi:MAG: ABC transporter permease [Flavobacteriales bacterium]|nr:ABC transporter permease [Flavobacteriales bacterium]
MVIFADKIEAGGKIPNFNNGVKNDSILISRYIADKLKLKLHDRVSTYFIKDTGPKERKFHICGIYNTGLEDFDKKFIFSDIRQVQELNLWGIETALQMSDQCVNGGFLIEASSFTNANNILYSWNNSAFIDQDRIVIYPTKDTIIQVVAAGFTPNDYADRPIMTVAPDTAYLSITVNSKSDSCLCSGIISANDYNGLNDSTLVYEYSNGTVTTTFSSPPGSRTSYVGGFEILLKDFSSIENASSIVRGEMLGMYSISTIDELHQDIFGWLNMLDANVYIIIILMVIVAVINMTAALLILILERTNMIGVLKALGAGNWSIQKIFLFNGAILIFKGLLIGNGVAFLLIYLQNQFGFIQLNPKTYFVKEVPMYFTPEYVIALNVFTLIICVLVLMLPALFVTRITPVKAIRFD